MEKKDIRVIKTQKALASAMLVLLEKRDFASITVNDLCMEALVSRSTFYVHFEDKYALLRLCMEQFNDQIFEKNAELILQDRIKSVLERIKSNVKVFKNLMLARPDMEMLGMMRVVFQEDLERVLSQPENRGVTLPGPIEIVSAFYAAGITNTIALWVNKDMIYSTDEMAAFLDALLPKR